MNKEDLEKLAADTFNDYLSVDESAFSERLERLTKAYYSNAKGDAYSLSNLLFLKYLSGDNLFISLNNDENVKKNRIISTILTLNSIVNGENPKFPKADSNELTNIIKTYYDLHLKNERMKVLRSSLKTLDGWLNNTSEEVMKEKHQDFFLSKYPFLTNEVIRSTMEDELTKGEYNLLAEIEDKIIKLDEQASPFNFKDPFLVFNKAILLQYGGKFDEATKLYNALSRKEDLSNLFDDDIQFSRYSHINLISYNSLSWVDNIRINKLLCSIGRNINSQGNNEKSWDDLKSQAVKIDIHSTKRKVMLALLEILSGKNKNATQVINSNFSYNNTNTFNQENQDQINSLNEDTFPPEFPTEDEQEDESYHSGQDFGSARDFISESMLSAILNPEEIEDNITAITSYYFTIKEQKEALTKGELLTNLYKTISNKKDFPRKILKQINWRRFSATGDLLKSWEPKQKRYKRRK